FDNFATEVLIEVERAAREEDRDIWTRSDQRYPVRAHWKTATFDMNRRVGEPIETKSLASSLAEGDLLDRHLFVERQRRREHQPAGEVYVTGTSRRAQAAAAMRTAGRKGDGHIRSQGCLAVSVEHTVNDCNFQRGQATRM